MALAHEPELSLGEHGGPERFNDYREPNEAVARLSAPIAGQIPAHLYRQRRRLIRSNLRGC